MNNLVNLTPHTINIQVNDEVIEIPSSGIARVKVEQNVVGEINDIPLVETRYGEVEGLPDPVEGTVYIVSGIVRSAIGGTRNDVVSPDTGPTAIRNEAGQIVAVTRLTR